MKENEEEEEENKEYTLQSFFPLSIYPKWPSLKRWLGRDGATGRESRRWICGKTKFFSKFLV